MIKEVPADGTVRSSTAGHAHERMSALRTFGFGGDDWGGQREGGPTDAELAFATSLNSLAPGLDYWLHADDDGTPWLLVSLDFFKKRAVSATLRLDFDDRGIRGGWSPSFSVS
ncbi:hypothetical protein Q5425_22140 [Amycolatopsis sp. A133]|uniref:hypothetical protein n=1 Tax=Amycolatopsis sp. A133 TaxID=3064472 RepID=UPI0027FABB21|nr:hypothetical protein [Amycolatopsis sp. A133]MDQ7806450.1 hypothetical protein [Amycolatopsis sp. A133]